MYRRIACVGGATLDRQVVPLGRLRPGTSNPVESPRTSPGGSARNVAEALARLGCPVTLFSRVGRDEAGRWILDTLGELGVDLGGIDRSETLPTASYTAVLEPSGQLAFGLADMEILDRLEPGWVDRIADTLSRHDLWIVDSNLPVPVLERLAAVAPEGTAVFADPVSVEKSARLVPILDRIDTIFPDRAEAAALLRQARSRPAPASTSGAGDPEGEEGGAAPSARPPADTDSVAGSSADPAADPAALAARVRELGPRRVVLTLGEEGVQVEDPPTRQAVPAREVAAVANVTGAGDCFLAGYVFGRISGGGIDPVAAGLAAAALSVESPLAVPRELTAQRLRERSR